MMSSSTEENVSSEALAAARREGALAERRRGRRRLLVVVGVAAALLAALLATGWVVVVQARDAAPEVISKMAVERQLAFEQRLSLRADEAAELAGDLFGFFQQVWLENESVRQIQSNLGGAYTELSLLDKEVRAALDSPLTELDPLLENGPTRARQLTEHLAAVTIEMRRLVPAVFKALGEAQQTFQDSPEGSTISAMLASMDALIEPFLDQNEALRARWKGLKNDVLAWVGQVEADFVSARRQMKGDALGEEFVDRLIRRLF